MTKIIILFSSIILGFTNPERSSMNMHQENITTYYLIRHAEKDKSDATNHDPNLTEIGMKRAENWAEVFKDVAFDAVYSTDYKRTIQTATPTATGKKLEIKSYDPGKLYNQDFRAATSGKTVLVVGHNNTTPMLANLILGEEKFAHLDHEENGALFIVQVCENGEKTCQLIYIN